MWRHPFSIPCLSVFFCTFALCPDVTHAVDTSGLDSTTKRYVEQAEAAVYRGNHESFKIAYERALARAGAIPQLAPLERTYIESLTGIQDAVSAYADYMQRWRGNPKDPDAALESVLRRAANLLLLSGGQDDIPLTVYKWFFDVTELLLNDLPAGRAAELETRAQTLTACGRAAYAAQEYSWAVRCFDGAKKAMTQAGNANDALMAEVMRQRANRRGRPATDRDNESAYALALQSRLTVRNRLLILHDIATGDWETNTQSQAAREILENNPETPEALLMQASGEW